LKVIDIDKFETRLDEYLNFIRPSEEELKDKNTLHMWEALNVMTSIVRSAALNSAVEIKEPRSRTKKPKVEIVS